MASIEKRPDGRYRARWREYPGGPQRAQHFDRKSDAQRFLDRIRGDLARGDYIDPSAGRVTFGDYAETWRRGQVHRPSTVALVESHLRLHALPTFGNRPLASIRPSEVQAWVKERSAVLAPSTVQTVYRITASVFRSAVRDRLIATTPCEQIKLPKLVRRQIVPLATEAVLRVADAMPDRYRALVIVASGTGLRQGEVFGLEVRHVDFLGRALRVEQQVVSVSGGSEPFIGPPKTASSVRTVPLPAIVTEQLARHFELLGLDQRDDRRLVFTNERDDPIRRTHFAEAFRRAVQSAGSKRRAIHRGIRNDLANLTNGWGDVHLQVGVSLVVVHVGASTSGKVWTGTGLGTPGPALGVGTDPSSGSTTLSGFLGIGVSQTEPGTSFGLLGGPKAGIGLFQNCAVPDPSAVSSWLKPLIHGC